MIDIFLIAITKLTHRHGIFITENVSLFRSPRNLILLKAEPLIYPCLDLPCFDLLIILFLKKLRKQEWRDCILKLILLNSTCQGWYSHFFISNTEQAPPVKWQWPSCSSYCSSYCWLRVSWTWTEDWGMPQCLREMVFINQYFNSVISYVYM